MHLESIIIILLILVLLVRVIDMMKKDDEDVVYSTEEVFDYFLTVRDLKEALKDVPDHIPVRYQRIEDFYFNVNHWTTKIKKWDNDSDSEYIRAFSAYYYDGDFVINAHY